VEQLVRWKNMDEIVGGAARRAMNDVSGILEDSIELEIDYSMGLVWVYYIRLADDGSFKQSNVGYTFSSLTEESGE
jgi:hypothetical protein